MPGVCRAYSRWPSGLISVPGGMSSGERMSPSKSSMVTGDCGRASIVRFEPSASTAASTSNPPSTSPTWFSIWTTRSGPFSPHPFVAGQPRPRRGDLAPRGLRQHPLAHLPAVRRIRVLPVEHGEPHGSWRKERRVQELLDLRNPGHPAGGVRERDEPVGLAAAVGGVEPEDRRRLAACPGEPTTNVAEQRLRAARRMRVPEEPHRIGVFLRAFATDNGRQLGRELGFADRPRQDIGARPAGLENSPDGHSGGLVLVARGQRSRSAPDDMTGYGPNPTEAGGRLSVTVSARMSSPSRGGWRLPDLRQGSPDVLRHLLDLQRHARSPPQLLLQRRSQWQQELL